MERWQTRILPSLPSPDRTDIVRWSLTRFPISRFRPGSTNLRFWVRPRVTRGGIRGEGRGREGEGDALDNS